LQAHPLRSLELHVLNSDLHLGGLGRRPTDPLTLILAHKLVHYRALEEVELFGAHGDLGGECLGNLGPVHSLISLLVLKFDEAAKRLEASEELHVLDQHVELARNDIEGHALISHQDVMRDVRLNQVVENDASGMSEGFLGVLKLSVVIFDMRRQEEGSEGPADELTKTHPAIEHIDLALSFVLERRLEEKLLVCLLDRELLDTLSKQFVDLHHMEVQVVDDAVGAHGVVAKAQARLLAQLEDL